MGCVWSGGHARSVLPSLPFSALTDIPFAGSLSYVELSLSLGRSGGTYSYLRAAFGSAFAFAFVLVNLILLLPTGLAILALTFANYAVLLLFEDGCGPPPNVIVKLLAVAAIGQ